MPKLPAFSIRDILLLTITTLTLLIILLIGWRVCLQWDQLSQIRHLKAATLVGDQLYETGEKFSVERHISFSILHAPDLETIRTFTATMVSSRKQSDMALGATMALIKKYSYPNLPAGIQAVESQMHVLKTLRSEIDARLSPSQLGKNHELADVWFRESTNMILRTQELWMTFMKNFIEINSIVNIQMRLKHFLSSAAEYTGRQHSIIGQLIVENTGITPPEQVQLLRWKSVADFSWSNVNIMAEQSRLGPVLQTYIRDAESDTANMYEMVRDPFYILGISQTAPYPISGETWLELTRQASDSLDTLRTASMKETREYMERLEGEAQRSIAAHFITLLFTLFLCGYSFHVVVYRVLKPIHTMIEALIDITTGKPVPPALTTVKQQDEIGKLAHVLSVFQLKMEELKKSSIAMRSYIDELKRSNQELDDFAYIASHDLKEPLRGLSHQAAFLMEDYKDKLDEEGVRHLNYLVYLSKRMEQLISDLLYYSRLGRGELAIQEVDPNDIVAEVKHMMATFLKEHNARIIVPQPMPSIVCDKMRVAEVFRNLITNAVKYNNKPEKIVEVGYLQSKNSSRGEEKNVFYIKDNGVGIDPEFHEIIFRIFKRLRNPDVKDEGGTGSGLTFVKKIIERHKGHIWLESEPGKGSTFFFTLGECRKSENV